MCQRQNTQFIDDDDDANAKRISSKNVVLCMFPLLLLLICCILMVIIWPFELPITLLKSESSLSSQSERLYCLNEEYYGNISCPTNISSLNASQTIINITCGNGPQNHTVNNITNQLCHIINYYTYETNATYGVSASDNPSRNVIVTETTTIKCGSIVVSCFNQNKYTPRIKKLYYMHLNQTLVYWDTTLHFRVLLFFLIVFLLLFSIVFLRRILKQERQAGRHTTTTNTHSRSHSHSNIEDDVDDNDSDEKIELIKSNSMHFYKHLHTFEPQTACTICMSELTTAYETQLCGHVFHKDCIDQWYNNNNNNNNDSCPLCRKKSTFIDRIERE